MYLKHKNGDASTIRFFEKEHGTNLLENYSTWEKATKAEIKRFEKQNNVVNDRTDSGSTEGTDTEQAES